MKDYIGSAVSGATGVTKEYPVADGVTVHDGDFVYLTGGRVTNASIAGKALLGQVSGQESTDPSNHNDTQETEGNSDGDKKVLVIVEPNAKYALTNDNDSTTFAESHVGQRFDLTGSAGSQVIDTSSVGTTGQFECVEFGYNGDDTVGVFIIAEHVYKS